MKHKAFDQMPVEVALHCSLVGLNFKGNIAKISLESRRVYPAPALRGKSARRGRKNLKFLGLRDILPSNKEIKNLLWSE